MALALMSSNAALLSPPPDPTLPHRRPQQLLSLKTPPIPPTSMAAATTSILPQNQETLAACFPALAWANVFYSSKYYNFKLPVDEDDPEEVLVRKFRRQTRISGVVQECRRRRYFENAQDKKKRKTREAANRNRWRRIQREGKFAKDQGKGGRQDALKEGKKEEEKDSDEDDNWELPEGEIDFCGFGC